MNKFNQNQITQKKLTCNDITTNIEISWEFFHSDFNLRLVYRKNQHVLIYFSKNIVVRLKLWTGKYCFVLKKLFLLSFDATVYTPWRFF